jgi:signal transduction histidine kinase
MNAVLQFEPRQTARPSNREKESQGLELAGRLVSGVAHDFNNILTGIALYCDLILQGTDASGSLHRYAEEIHTACEHGGALVQQLMAVARQEEVEPRILSWNDVLNELQYLLARLVGSNIEVIAELEDDPGQMRIAPSRAQQIALNLILNARDALPEGGQIRLRTRRIAAAAPSAKASGFAELTVSDNGTGIDPAIREQLGTPFVTTKKRGRGTGLGLATVYSIVEQQRGSVEIESEQKAGTTVTVRLPLAAEASTARAAG